MKIINCFLIVAITLLLNSCGNPIDNLPLPIKHDRGGNSSSPSYSSLRWPESALPLRIIAPISIQATIEPSLRKVCDSWNAAIGRHVLDYSFEDYPASVSSSNLLNNGRHRIYLQNPWSNVSSDNNALALTFYTFGGNIMYDGDIVFNANFRFYFSDASPSGGQASFAQFDFETILLHEVGHFLGLDHNNNTSSIMYPYVSMGTMKRALNQVDITAISNKYR